MAQNFGALTSITTTSRSGLSVAVAMPNGEEIMLAIEQPSDGSAAFLVIRTMREMEIRPVASNTIGIRIADDR